MAPPSVICPEDGKVKLPMDTGGGKVENLFYDLIAEFHIRDGFAQVLYQNPAFFEFPTTRLNFLEAREHFLRTNVARDDIDRVDNYWSEEAVRDFIGNGQRPMIRHFCYCLSSKKGYRKMEQTVLCASDEGKQGGLMVMLRDISEEKDERLQQLDAEDSRLRTLVGLPRIEDFYVNAEKLLHTYPERRFLLVNTDINHYKLFEAIHGQEKAEKMLMMVAEDIKGLLRTHIGTAAYLGDDYFTLLVAVEKELPEIEEMARKQLQQMADANMGFSESIGIYPVQDPNEYPEKMYDKAMLALNSVRNDFRRNVAVYKPGAYLPKAREEELIADVRRGIAAGEFTFYTQPVVDANTGKTVSLEALVRWIKDGRVISPGVYIPALEKNGYVVMLDEHIWEQVFRRQRQMLDENVETIPCSVNVSRIDFELIDLCQVFGALLEKYQIDPGKIGIEVTESAYAENYEAVQKTVKKLRSMGFRIYLDDFGSGYSNLNSLSDMQLDILKLDMRFVQGSDSGRTIKIMESIVNMAHLLMLPVICEGVETEEQLQMVKAIGINYVQGYYYYRPFPYQQIEVMLRERSDIQDGGICLHRADRVHMGEMFDDNVYSDTLLNHILGPVAFYEMDQEKHVRIVRVNDLYYSIVGREALNDADYADHITDYVVNKRDILRLLEEAAAQPLSGSEANIIYRRADGQQLTIYAHAVLISKQEGGVGRYFVSLRNFTPIYDKIRAELKQEAEENDQ